MIELTRGESMKKRKFNLLLEIATICLCVAAIAFGVYSAKTASLNVTGTIGFNAHNCNVYVYATLSGAANADGNTVTVNDFGTSDQYINVHDNTSAWEIGDIYFDDINNTDDSKLAKDITITISMYNESKYPVYAVFNKDNLGIDTTQISATASQAIVTLPANQTKADKTELTITFTVLKDSITALTLSADKPLVKFTKDKPMPTKGQLITMDLGIDSSTIYDGKANTYRILKMQGNTAQVFAMFITEDGIEVKYRDDGIPISLLYNGSTLDTYLNETWYNKLNSTAKEAIIKSNINVYYYSSSEEYNAKTHSSDADYTSKTLGEELQRFVYALDIEDIEEYFKTNSSDSQGIFGVEDLNNFAGRQYYSNGCRTWLRSGAGSDNAAKYYLSSGSISYESDQYMSFGGIASFTIDLSKIDWTLSA